MDKVLCLGCMQEKQQQPICELCGYDERVQNQAHQLPVGTILQNQYLIGKVLGQGGFGITYAGWDNLLMVPVAIKEYYPSGTVIRNSSHSTEVTCSGELQQSYAAHKERFLQEARILAKVSGVPEIVQIKNHFHQNNTAYTVMEFVRGITLKEYMRRNGGPLTVQQTLDVMKPVINALDKVHKLGLVHRDISPDNIMLQPDGSVKLIDFGTARYVDNADVDNPLSKSTESILKHGFAPMEQYQSRGSLGPWTDVYALCCTIYYCMTGKVLMDAPTRVSEEDDLDLQSRIPGLTAAQAAVLEKGLAVRAKDRIRSLEELSKLLYPEKKPESRPDPKPKPEPKPKTPKEPKSPPDPRTPRNNPLKFILAIAAVIVCCCVGFFAFSSRDGSQTPQIQIQEPSAAAEANAPNVAAETQQPVVTTTTASELTLWVYPWGNWANHEKLTPLLETFQSQTGIKVHVEYLNYADGDDKVETAIAAGKTPDLILESPERLVAKWGKYMVDISDMFDEEDRAQIYPSVLDACSKNGSTITMYPLTMIVHSMAINKTVFQAAGAMQYVDEDTHTWTTEQFRAAMDQVFLYTGKPAGAIYCVGQGGDQGTRALVTNIMGGSFVNEDRTAYTWDSPENIAAFKYLHDMPSVQYDPSIAGGDEIALFYNGSLNVAFCWNIAQQLNPNSAGTGAERTANGDEILFMAFPAPEGVTPQLQGMIAGFGIFDHDDPAREEAARIFIRYFCDSEATAESVRLANYFPVRTAAEGYDLTTVWAGNEIMQEYSKITPLLGNYCALAPDWSEARTLWWNMLQEMEIAYGNEAAITRIAQEYTRAANKQ